MKAAGTERWPCLPRLTHSIPSRAFSSFLCLCHGEERAQTSLQPLLLLQALPGYRKPGTGTATNTGLHPDLAVPTASSSGHCSCSPLCTALITLITPPLQPYPTRAGGHPVPVQQGSINKYKYRNNNTSEGVAGRASGTRR